MTAASINKKIKAIKPSLKVNIVDLPNGKSINNLLVAGNITTLDELLHHQPQEVLTPVVPNEVLPISIPALAPEEETTSNFQVISDQHTQYKGSEAIYHAKGNLSNDQKVLEILLVVEDKYSKRKHRYRVDLYKKDHLRTVVEELEALENYQVSAVKEDLNSFTTLLEEHRDQLLAPIQTKTTTKKQATPAHYQKAMELLQDPKLFQHLDTLIAQAGVVGEEKTRLSLFVMAASYKIPYPLHTLLQGESGSGKSHLLKTISSCIPPEDVLSLTRVTSKSFYHYGEGELQNKLLLIQDYDGLDTDAQYAFREMQSAGELSLSTTLKDRWGNSKTGVKVVDAHFSSIIATTNAEVYQDNMNRSVVVGTDESAEQTQKILLHQNQLTAGMINQKKVEQAKEILRCIIRQVYTKPVVNHYAAKVLLPLNVKSIRRLNNQFQSLVTQVTLLHQYQRSTDEQGRIITTIADLTAAVELFAEAMYMKTDELDSSTRQFFEQLKQYVKTQSKGSTQTFGSREVRLALQTNKTQVFRCIEKLKALEYIAVSGGSSNKGYKYQITYWDDVAKMRHQIKEHFTQQIKQLEPLEANGSNLYDASGSTNQ
ncbi:MAG: hypothetical protein OQJ96_05970 [Flavobacteriales bacterium]|nr:hypothetical protein [Flavobacteriales bacterium]MCW8937624.1 hypothetical protein [Flavobacteriales bacterium]MCW8990112.1 hypothetical protein [Flavobacteriales bacterium]MCW9019830.1 hypothetical protein [Flavobacteriales bacterium]